MPFLSYYYFRFIGRHCYFRLSADIGDGAVETAVPENRGVAVEISFLSGQGVKLEGVADLPPLPPLSALQNPVRCPRINSALCGVHTGVLSVGQSDRRSVG